MCLTPGLHAHRWTFVTLIQTTPMMGTYAQFKWEVPHLQVTNVTKPRKQNELPTQPIGRGHPRVKPTKRFKDRSAHEDQTEFPGFAALFVTKETTPNTPLIGASSTSAAC